MVDREDFDPSIALPPGLEIGQITGGGGRTHTFGVKKPATRFRGCSVYRRHGIRIRAGKPVPENGA